MASSALSARRSFLRRPKVCKASPNPGRCQPLPPPPPPPFWGPATIRIFGWAYWRARGRASCSGSWDSEIPVDEALQAYYCINLAPTAGSVKLTLFVYTEDPEILRVTYALSNDPCSASGYRDDVPYTRDPPDFLTISTWYDVEPLYSEPIISLEF